METPHLVAPMVRFRCSHRQSRNPLPQESHEACALPPVCLGAILYVAHLAQGALTVCLHGTVASQRDGEVKRVTSC